MAVELMEAGAGFEPATFQVMSLPRYQTAPPRYVLIVIQKSKRHSKVALRLVIEATRDVVMLWGKQSNYTANLTGMRRLNCTTDRQTLPIPLPFQA